MNIVKWSIPGHAHATILLPQSHINSVIAFNMTPVNNTDAAVRGAVNSNTFPDFVDIEHFDHVLKRSQRLNRVIHVDMVHHQESFDAQLAFSFVGGTKTHGDVVPFKTNARGITRLSVLAELV